MPRFFSITVRFLQPFSHGRGEGNEPEWPPSPLRLFQAMVASSAGRWNERSTLNSAVSALNWLETQTPLEIVAAEAVCADQPFRLYVPDNVTDKPAKSWSKGRYADIADYRTEKDVRPMRLSGESVHYLYPLPNDQFSHEEILTTAARNITHLGWGIDMVAGDLRILSAKEAASLDGARWRLTPGSGKPLRIPVEGTLNNLMSKHEDFLNRFSNEGFKPVPPLKVFQVYRYRKENEPLQRPYAVFELRNDDGSFFRYPQRKLIHISGMVRCLAIKALEKSPPNGVPEDWVETYVAGHTKSGDNNHKQISYIPLPSIGHLHSDLLIRRVMIAAPVGDDEWLEHITRWLEGNQLKPTPETKINKRPALIRSRYDKVARLYNKPTNMWASVTPVILPGHNDHKPEKTRKLIEKALAQSGIEQPCEFEWSAISCFPKSMTAHKYDRDKNDRNKKIFKPWLPKYLQNFTAVHLILRFKDGVKVPGPLAIGAGRHCGLGIFANEHFNFKKTNH